MISILSNLIEAIKKEDEGRKRDGVLIVIDEMQNMNDTAKCAQLLRGIITTLDVKSLGNIGFLLIGYESAVKDFFEGDPSARRQFDSIGLGVMPIDEALREQGYEKLLPPFVPELRKRVKEWRDKGYEGASAASKGAILLSCLSRKYIRGLMNEYIP